MNRGNEFAQKFETLPGKLPAAKLDIPASVAADPDRAVETRRKCPLTAGFSNAFFESLVLRKGTRPISGLSLCGKAGGTNGRLGQLSASALLHPAQSSAVFIINIAESDFRHPHLPIRAGHPI